MSEWTEKDVKEISGWNEKAHPRGQPDNAGQFVKKSEQTASELKAELQREVAAKPPTVKSTTAKMTPAEKIASVHIDFSKDNILPELNDSELAKVGAKENKPIRIKKSIIDRNKFYHEDAMINTNKILGETLYSPSEIFPGKSDKDYFTFIKPLRLSKRNGKDEYGVVLLDVTNTNKNFDVVHWHWVNIENLNSLKPNKKD